MSSDACPVCSLSHAKYKIFNSFILFDTDLNVFVYAGSLSPHHPTTSDVNQP
jgi:hypothetical protein